MSYFLYNKSCLKQHSRTHALCAINYGWCCRTPRWWSRRRQNISRTNCATFTTWCWPPTFDSSIPCLVNLGLIFTVTGNGVKSILSDGLSATRRRIRNSDKLIPFMHILKKLVQLFFTIVKFLIFQTQRICFTSSTTLSLKSYWHLLESVKPNPSQYLI